MKNIKSFKLFESINMSEIEDVLQELTDIGFKYNVNTYVNGVTEINIRNEFNKYIKISQLKDTILRIQDMTEKNIKLILTNNDYGTTVIRKFDEKNLIISQLDFEWEYINDKRDLIAVSIVIGNE